MCYGIFILALEMLGAASVFTYGIYICWLPAHKDATTRDDKGVPFTRLLYVVRVVVPCYKEPLDVVKATVQAAYDAPLPHGCAKYVYLCDDGKDPQKKELMHSFKVRCG